MATTLTAQNTLAPAQTTAAPTRVFQPRTTKAPEVQQAVVQPPVVQHQQQVTQVPSTPVQVIQMPATPGPSAAGNVQTPQGTVRYIKIPAGVTKATYNLRPSTLSNATASNTATVTSAPVTAGRG